MKKSQKFLKKKLTVSGVRYSARVMLENRQNLLTIAFRNRKMQFYFIFYENYTRKISIKVSGLNNNHYTSKSLHYIFSKYFNILKSKISIVGQVQ